MKSRTRIDIILVSLGVAAVVVLAGSTHPEKALWIKITEHGKLKTTIAITEPIARLIAESDKDHVHFSSHNDRDLVTRDMMKAVLNGRTSSVTGEDPDEDTKAELFMKTLDLPGVKGNKSRFVLETYKGGLNRSGSLKKRQSPGSASFLEKKLAGKGGTRPAC
ncbi:MAG: hypothetical protein NTV54_08645, partial [Ignavibacteriales bacterium]|nr:hypothetical protein [Ignavibacteriales bacterium]